MIHTHSLGRAARYFAGRPALASGGRRSTFRELRDRVASIAVALHGHGFAAGDRLALLLPNESEYIELVYACAWLGVIVVPLNTRLTAMELDHVLTDASPRGLIRHSSLPVPTVQPPWQRVIDEEPLDDPPFPPLGKGGHRGGVATPSTTRKRSSLSSTRAAQPAAPKVSC